MKRILVISLYAPYDGIDHAGGKIHNYYLKKLNKSNQLNIRLLSFCEPQNYQKIHKDLQKYRVEHDVMSHDNSMRYKILNKIRRYNFGDRYATLVSKDTQYQLRWKLKQYAKEGYNPDIIIMVWTQITIQIDQIKKVFPSAKYIAVEHDVNFQGMFRKAESQHNVLKRLGYQIKAKRGRICELNAVKRCNVIITYNQKDKRLLKENGLERKKILVLSPWIQKLDIIQRKPDRKNPFLMFYGAMNREENYLSVIWFIENVYPSIADRGIRLVIVGGNPSEQLKKYESDKIIITGYVDDISKYFSECLCMIAPLVLGAGIKIKILEALSIGAIVLTNEIGTEGIAIQDEVHYLKCIKAEDYKEKILKLLDGEIDTNSISNHAIEFMISHFNVESDAHKYLTMLEKL